jgi:glycosyltransferase involved in cell wall biosynthesis
MTPPELALVVPCYNEAARLAPEAFLRFASAHPAVQLVFVDDGSTDGTREIHERMRAAAPQRVTALHHAPRRGKAEAVRTGILAGITQQAALVGFLDADLSTPLGAIDDFLAVLRTRPSIEFVLGSRVMLLGRDVTRKMPRHYLGRVFATAVSHALDLPVYDTQCGAKVLRANDATASLFAEPFRSRWIFDVELIARYLRLPVAPGEPARRDRLYELVVPAWHDIPGSKVRWYDFARSALELAHVWRERVAHRPKARTRSEPPWPAATANVARPAFTPCDGPDVETGHRTFPGTDAWPHAAHVPRVPVTIQLPREGGLAQESTR